MSTTPRGDLSKSCAQPGLDLGLAGAQRNGSQPLQRTRFTQAVPWVGRGTPSLGLEHPEEAQWGQQPGARGNRMTGHRVEPRPGLNLGPVAISQGGRAWAGLPGPLALCLCSQLPQTGKPQVLPQPVTEAATSPSLLYLSGPSLHLGTWGCPPLLSLHVLPTPLPPWSLCQAWRQW